MKHYVFDSYAIIAFFEDEAGAATVEKAIRQVVGQEAHGWMSIINWGEVFYCTYREQGAEAAEEVISQLAMYPIELVDVDRRLALEAATLKGKYRVAYADCSRWHSQKGSVRKFLPAIQNSTSLVRFT